MASNRYDEYLAHLATSAGALRFLVVATPHRPFLGSASRLYRIIVEPRNCSPQEVL
jgi:hypothetical protein